jgi:hypothetical protein
MEALAAFHFERHGITGRQCPEMPDDFFPIGEAVFADGLADERLQDLLGAPAADVSSTRSCNSTAVAAMDYTGSSNWAVGVYFPPPLASRNIASRS